VDGGVPELSEVEEHLQVAVHVAGVALIDQTAVQLAHSFLPSQRQHDEPIRPCAFGFEADDFAPLVVLERAATALDDLADDLSLAQPAVLSMHYQHALAIRPDTAHHTATFRFHLHFRWSCFHTREGKGCGSWSSEEGEGKLEDEACELSLEGLEGQ
jgi:hypothetical protein